jgi:DNA-binding NarL/FixJ family response regulator
MTDTVSESPPLRVLVVDADERVRESLAGLLGIGDRCIVIGSASHAGQALDLVTANPTDVIVMDPRLPEVDAGRAFIARVRELSPSTRILVMAWTDGVEQDGVVNGADAFIRKTFRPRELVDAVCAAAQRVSD